MDSEIKHMLAAANCKHGSSTTYSVASRRRVSERLGGPHELAPNTCESAIIRQPARLQSHQPLREPREERARMTIREPARPPRGGLARLIGGSLAIALVCVLSFTQATSSPGETSSSANSPSSSPGSASAPPAAASSSSASQAALSPVAQIATSALLSAIDSAASASKDPAASQQSQKSIVASLSSAVASAAAAAAVAAAQNSLSGGDARSLLGSNPRRDAPAGQSRSPGLNLALKLADSIPEVPYNILHNMKKVDHAAPFYNVPNRMSGASKESASHGLLASALSASGGFGGAADQLGALLKSPVWKRIADGYGEFTSEFRSLFRAPAAPMKGSTGTASRLLRELSVPALLMLLATSLPSEWRPVRTRRKSLLPSVAETAKALPAGLDPMAVAASNSQELPNFSMTPELLPAAFAQAGQATPRAAPYGAGQSNSMYPPAPEMMHSGQFVAADQIAANNELPSRANGDINLQAASEASWQSAATSLAPLNQMSSSQQQQQDYFGSHLAQQQQAPGQAALTANLQQQQQPMMRRRFGDTLTLDAKPVKREQQQQHSLALGSNQNSASLSPASGSVGSLTSALTVGGQAGQRAASSPAALIMNKIMNANRELIQLARQPSDLLGSLGLSSNSRKDQLADKHKYSLVGLDTDAEPLAYGGLGVPSQPAGDHALRWSPGARPHFSLASLTKTLGLLSGQVQAKSSSPEEHWPSLAPGAPINRRQAQQPEQRDLTQLLPTTWREAVKRTMSSVQQQASTQWRSIEGQLTNWVQDKLKTLPATATNASGSSGQPSSGGASGQVANLIASVSSTAMNMLGLGGKSSSPSAGNQSSGLSTSSPAVEQAQQASSQQRSKLESPVKAAGQPIKTSLAGMADMIVNSLTNKLSGNDQTKQSSANQDSAPGQPTSAPVATSTSSS